MEILQLYGRHDRVNKIKRGYVKSYLIDNLVMFQRNYLDTWIKPLIIDRIVKDEKGSETLYFIGRDKMFCNIVNKKILSHPLSIAIEHVTNKKYDVKIEIKKTVKRTSIINNKVLLSKPKINDSNPKCKIHFQ